MSWLRRPRQILWLVLVNLVTFCVVAEAAGLVAFYYQRGWLFYIDPYKPTFVAPTGAQEGAGLTAVGLHPYFGPTHRSGIPFDIPVDQREPGSTAPSVPTNNFGFVSAHSYPYARRSPDEYLVGIFGGSVGAWFCEIGSSRLAQQLSTQPALRGRHIVPLCFAHEGYKQPQQLIVLAYFLSIGQPFDLVVNIDGFNEVALSAINEQRGFDASMPSAVHLEPLINLVNQSTLTPDKLDSLYQIAQLRRRLTRLVPALSATRFASVFVTLEQVYRLTQIQYEAERARFNQLPSNPPANSAIHATPPVAVRQGDALFESVATSWATASTMMQALLVPRGIAYVHVLQPNQYFTTRRFGAEEARVALQADSPFKPSVERGYPFLLKALQAAAATGGLHAVDGTHAFDAEPGAVYVDNCCHYTRRGNLLLADLIAREVVLGTTRAH